MGFVKKFKSYVFHVEKIIFLYLQANGLAHRNQNIYIVHDTNSSYLGIHYNNRRDFSKFDRSMMTDP
jgi:hypothetical protein